MKLSVVICLKFQRVPQFNSFKNQYSKAYYLSVPFCYFSKNILFAVTVPHMHVNTLNYAPIFHPDMGTL